MACALCETPRSKLAGYKIHVSVCSYFILSTHSSEEKDSSEDEDEVMEAEEEVVDIEEIDEEKLHETTRGKRRKTVIYLMKAKEICGSKSLWTFYTDCVELEGGGCY